MSGIYNCIICKDQKLLPNAGYELFVTAARQVGPADRTGKQAIADKKVIADMQADPAGRMAGQVYDLQGQLTDFNFISFSQQPVRLWRCHNT